MSKEEYYKYTEPHPSGGVCTVCMTRKQAIDWTRKIHQGLSDTQALEDFIVVHWANKIGDNMSSLTQKEKEYYSDLAIKHADFLCDKIFKPAFEMAFIHGAKHMKDDIASDIFTKPQTSEVNSV